MKLWNIVFKDKSFSHFNPQSEIKVYKQMKICIFGSAFLHESNQLFFQWISKDLEIHHFILNPCQIYWGDFSKTEEFGRFTLDGNSSEETAIIGIDAFK